MNLQSKTFRLKTWKYGQFELRTPLNPDECKQRLKAQSIVMTPGAVLTNRGAAFRTPAPSVEARMQLKGNRFSLGLEQEYQEKAMAAVIAKGMLSRHSQGSRLKITIGQMPDMIRLIVGLFVFWAVVGVIAIARLVYTQSFGESREMFIMFGFVTLVFMPRLYSFAKVTPTQEAGPATLAFLLKTLDATLVSDSPDVPLPLQSTV